MPKYLVGLGSNIAPEHNMSRMLAWLAEHFAPIWVSQIVRTPPMAMQAQSYEFLNAVVYFETSINATQLKSQFNQLETHLGRNRADPLTKVKNRPADLDILAALDEPSVGPVLSRECYFQPLVQALMAYLQGSDSLAQVPYPCQRIEVDGVSLGEVPTTIYWQAYASNKGVVQEA